MTTPYTYLLKHKSGKLYFGVRYAKDCCPSDLWKTYFTSSKHVLKMIEEDGKDSFTVLHVHVHLNKDEARLFETKVLKKFNAHRNPKFINRSCGGDKFWCPDFISPESRERYRQAKIGTKASVETRMRMSKTRTGMLHKIESILLMRKPKTIEHSKKRGPLFEQLENIRQIWIDHGRPSYRALSRILNVEAAAVRNMYYKELKEHNNAVDL